MYIRTIYVHMRSAQTKAHFFRSLEGRFGGRGEIGGGWKRVERTLLQKIAEKQCPEGDGTLRFLSLFIYLFLFAFFLSSFFLVLELLSFDIKFRVSILEWLCPEPQQLIITMYFRRRSLPNPFLVSGLISQNLSPVLFCVHDAQFFCNTLGNVENICAEIHHTPSQQTKSIGHELYVPQLSLSSLISLVCESTV